MNCTTLDSAFDDGKVFFLQEDSGLVVGITLLSLFSLLLLLRGERVVRIVTVILVGLSGVMASYVLADSLSCEGRLVFSASVGAICAISCACLLRSGFFLVGGVGFGAAGHFLYDTLPLKDASPPLEFLSISAYQYMFLLGSGVIGCVIACFMKKDLLRLSSSLLGGTGISLCVVLASDRLSPSSPPHPLLLLGIVIVCTTAGTLFQREMHRRRKNRKK